MDDFVHQGRFDKLLVIDSWNGEAGDLQHIYWLKTNPESQAQLG